MDEFERPLARKNREIREILTRCGLTVNSKRSVRKRKDDGAKTILWKSAQARLLGGMTQPRDFGGDSQTWQSHRLALHKDGWP
jgi:hypothetical protein